MSFERWKDTAIIIPARNEAKRIGACLSALAPQCNDRIRVILVVNNTDDDTAKIATLAAARHGIDLSVLDLTFPPGMGVGAARRKGGYPAYSAGRNEIFGRRLFAECSDLS